MNETDFHQRADATVNSLLDALEEADASGAFDVEYQGGVMTITLPDGRQWIVSKHTASRQIWLSSPVSGGLHFTFADASWILPDGRILANVLSQELAVKVAC